MKSKIGWKDTLHGTKRKEKRTLAAARPREQRSQKRGRPGKFSQWTGRPRQTLNPANGTRKRNDEGILLEDKSPRVGWRAEKKKTRKAYKNKNLGTDELTPGEKKTQKQQGGKYKKISGTWRVGSASTRHWGKIV